MSSIMPSTGAAKCRLESSRAFEPMVVFYGCDLNRSSLPGSQHFPPLRETMA